VDRLALLYTFFPEEYVLRESWLKELERRWVRARRNGRGERPHLLLDNFAQRLEARGKAFDRHFLSRRFLDREGFSKASVSFFEHHGAHAGWYASRAGAPRSIAESNGRQRMLPAIKVRRCKG